MSYLPVIDLLRRYFQIEGWDDKRKIREKVIGKLLSLDRALESSLGALLALLEASVDDEEWTRLEPPERRRRTLDGVRHLLLRESRVQVARPRPRPSISGSSLGLSSLRWGSTTASSTTCGKPRSSRGSSATDGGWGSSSPTWAP
jgi:hypothetical protein